MKRLLIVDDQQGIRLLLNEVLKKEGYITYLAANGSEALKYADEQEMDCVLLDMKIPGMDGIEILRRLKKKFPKLPVFMMTAYGELDVVQEALELKQKQKVMLLVNSILITLNGLKQFYKQLKKKSLQ